MKKLFTCLMLMVGMLLPLTATAADLKADLTIYYDVSTFGDFSGKKLQVMIGHGSYSTTYAMKAVEGYDNLYSVNIGEVNDGNTWGNATQLGFMAADAIWGGESNGSSSQPKERIKWAPMYSGIYNITSTLSGNVLFTGKDALSITKDYKLPAKTPVITLGAAPEFATTTVGETSSATLKYTLENATEATATIEGEGFSISAQAVGSVTIAFAPEAEGDYTGTLTITSGEVKETVALAAKAVAAEAPKVPEFLNVTTPVFAEIIEGEVTTAEVTYELVNATEATASVDGEFFSIQEQELGKVIIEFASEEAGVFEGTLTLTSGETVKEITFTATAVKAPVIVTISFVNPDWKEAALYAWVEGGENLTGGNWPGKPMTKGENNKFTYDLTIPEDGVYKFIINNNNNGLQSVNMTGVTESTCYNLGAKVGDNYSLVVSENCEYTPAPEPEPIDPYVAIRGTMTNWSMENDIKMTYNAEAANGPEWYITAFEVPADGKFKVVSVDDKSQPTWYGSDKVDLQEGITNDGKGDGDIALPAGKYDIYFKVNEGRMWIQKYVAPEEPKPSLIVSTEEVEFEEVELGDEPVSATQTITYTVENSEEAVVLALESDVFTAEDAEGTITITFAPTSEGEYTAELTLTLGDIVKTIAISGAAKAAEIVDPEEPKINIIVADFERNTAEVGDDTDAAIVYSLVNLESAEVEIEGEYVTFEQTEVDEGFMIAVYFRPEEVGEFPGKLTITAGEISEEIEFTFIATEPEEPDNTITFTVKVPEGTKECWIAGTPAWTFIQMEKVEGEENLYTLTVENTVLDRDEWKYLSGAGWAYVEVRDGDANRTEEEDPYDVVTSWKKLYDPDFEPIEPYYAIRGDMTGWTDYKNDIKLTEDADNDQWYIKEFEVNGTDAFKVVYVDENANVCDECWYSNIEESVATDIYTGGNGDNITLVAGKYDIYFKPGTGAMWIAKVIPDTPTDVEDAVAELIYAVDGTIFAPAPFAIIDLSGKDVTNANGSLEGTYIVKTQNSVTKVLVK